MGWADATVQRDPADLVDGPLSHAQGGGSFGHDVQARLRVSDSRVVNGLDEVLDGAAAWSQATRSMTGSGG
jgi:hypothetical protein